MKLYLTGFKPRLLIGWWKMWRSLPVMDWIRGAELFRAGDFKQASFFYERGLQKYPKHVAANCARLDFAYCLYQQNELLLAAEELKKITESGSQLKDAMLLLARIQTILGLDDDSTKTMKRCLSWYPEDTQVAICYGYSIFGSTASLQQKKQARDYIQSFQDRLKLDDARYAQVETAVAHFDTLYGDPEAGERSLMRVLASGEAPFEAILLRGFTWLKQGRVTQAREQLERAIKHTPTDPRPYSYLAQSYLLEGELNEPDFAVQLATASCKMSSWQNRSCLTTLRDAYIGTDDTDMIELIECRLNSIVPAQNTAPVRKKSGESARSKPQLI